ISSSFFPLSFVTNAPVRADPHSFPTRRSSDLPSARCRSSSRRCRVTTRTGCAGPSRRRRGASAIGWSLRASRRVEVVGVHGDQRSEEHTSELQSRENLVCRLLLEKKKKKMHKK